MKAPDGDGRPYSADTAMLRLYQRMDDDLDTLTCEDVAAAVQHWVVGSWGEFLDIVEHRKVTKCA